MQDFTNDTLDINALPKYEKVSLNAVSKHYWKVVLLNISIILVIAGSILTILTLFLSELRPYSYILLTVYIIFALSTLLLYKASIQRRGYALRQKDLIYRSGILSIKTSIVPFIRVQHISMNEGIFSRMFGLATLHIFTAGGSSGNINITGLELAQAKKIKEIISRQIDEID